MLKRYLFCFAVFSLISIQVFAQEPRTNQHVGQAWIGYMTSVRLNNRFSLWNDFHLATDNFFIGRHGLTVHLNRQVTLTGGYAWLFLAPSFTSSLVRQEHRPWGQLMFTESITDKWQTQQRFRYDARFRENVRDNQVIEGEYGFMHRLRYMFNIRRLIKGESFTKPSIFMSINSEILINFGEAVAQNNLDQFRASLLVGRTFNTITAQVGYMYRYVPQGAPNTYKTFHGATLWINHNFRTKRGGVDDIIRVK